MYNNLNVVQTQVTAQHIMYWKYEFTISLMWDCFAVFLFTWVKTPFFCYDTPSTQSCPSLFRRQH